MQKKSKKKPSQLSQTHSKQAVSLRKGVVLAGSENKDPKPVFLNKKGIKTSLRFSKKDFRESLVLEQFYKTIYEHNLRESAYKTAIEIYLSRKN